MTSRPLNVAVVGAGPAGVFTADILTQQDFDVRVDLFERLPVPFGLVRYGVAPDHPRMKSIIQSLHNVLGRGDIRLVAGIEVGSDVTIEQLRGAYDAVILTTGANSDAPLAIPGVDLPGSYGSSEFVAWYNAHPDAPRTWNLDAEHVAVIGAGNVALDITRMLTKGAQDLATTEMPEHINAEFRRSRVTDVHVFARRGPAEAQFSPVELRELDQMPGVDIIVAAEDMVVERSSEALMARFNQRRLVAQTLLRWSQRDPETFTGSRRIHLHFMQAPVRIEGTDRVEALTVERTQHLVNGMVEGTGEFLTYPVGQVYRAVGYASSPVTGVPFDLGHQRIPHRMGRILGADGESITGMYCSGWIKRGPVGLIGSTKSDSQQTVSQLAQDVVEGRLTGTGGDPLPGLLEGSDLRGIDWSGWLRVDEHEKALGQAQGRERVKVYDRDELAAIALELTVTV